jgi:hypothetical protein
VRGGGLVVARGGGRGGGAAWASLTLEGRGSSRCHTAAVCSHRPLVACTPTSTGCLPAFPFCLSDSFWCLPPPPPALPAARPACRAQLNEEQLRGSKLRSELASLGGSHLKDQQERSGLLADTLARLQVGPGGREEAGASSMRRGAGGRLTSGPLTGALVHVCWFLLSGCWLTGPRAVAPFAWPANFCLSCWLPAWPAG